MSDMSHMPSGNISEPIFTAPSLPKGGGTVTAGGGMLSFGGADATASWSVPLPGPSGRTLSPSLTLGYSSGGGNGPFGAGWDLSVPAIFRMTRFGIPRYGHDDRLLGPDGEEILRDKDGVRSASGLPFSQQSSGPYIVTRWVPRSGTRSTTLEHWVSEAYVAKNADSPGFWLQWHPDGSITLYGWSTQARLSDPTNPSHVAGWYIEETVNATGEHVVYTWRGENELGCHEDEKRQHPHVANVYLHGVFAMNVEASEALLVPDKAFLESDFLTFMLVDYGERGADPARLPTSEPATWPVREDCCSFWRYGFEVRTRRLCRDLLLWHRTKMMSGENNPTPQLVSRLHLSYETSGVTSELVSARQMAYEADSTAVTLPPVEFALSRPGGNTGGWEAMTALNGFCPPRWQMADLYGDGLPGLLYQDSGAWWYRAPERDEQKGGDAVTWGAAVPVPFTPALKGGMLTDLDGDGCAEWLVTMPGLHGSFTLISEGEWGHFIPLDAMPSELLHPSAQLVDLTGSGLQDVVMIGPRSVRLWSSSGSLGWAPSENTKYNGMEPLPVGNSHERLIAFTDPMGSGQQHLVEITGDSVTCWPSLGHGRFGERVCIPGFAIDNFKAERVYLGDTDGSGTTDILYIEPECIRIFVSESGNRFVERDAIPAPDGVVFDNLCTIQVADIRGQGTVDLMVNVPHMSARTWCWRFNERRPWLLSEVCTNTGNRTCFDYRSSAQGWLDEKAELKHNAKPAISYLPFPVHMLSQVRVIDDISGIVTGSQMRYMRGVWDGKEREFRGFRRLIQRDTVEHSQGTAVDWAPVCEVRSWFLCGVEELDGEAEESFTAVDSAEHDFESKPLRIIRRETDNPESTFTPEGDQRHWVLRALKGMPVRTETYGRDKSVFADVPYLITRQRWQLSVTETRDPEKPSVQVTPVENLTFEMERIAQDAKVNQSLVLEQDAYGNILRDVDICYPRKGTSSDPAYQLPVGLASATEDDQQRIVWLTLKRHEFCNIRDKARHVHLTGLTASTRSDIFRLVPATVPAGGFSVESLNEFNDALSVFGPSELGGYLRTQWCDGQNNLTDYPVRQALTAYTETALLDDPTLTMLRDIRPEAIDSVLDKGGYKPLILPDGIRVMSGRHNFARYAGPDAFYRLVGTRSNELSGETSLTWDPHYTVVTCVRDAAGLETRSEYDWRFLLPVSVTDPNDNVHEIALDALGRATQSRFRGTEAGKMTGYSTTRFEMPQNVDDTLKLKGIPVATAQHIVTDSWMPFDRDAEGRIRDVRTGELALRRFISQHQLTDINIREGCEPLHCISVMSDRYDSSPEQQVRISVTFSDGGGRLLQTAVLNPAGEALVRTTEGKLLADAQGKAVTTTVGTRWAVTGKTEYDQKGHPVRTWMPFYLNDWRTVYDDSAREGIYADKLIYDALGRVAKVITAAGWERRTRYCPWFTLYEDENDTAGEVVTRQHSVSEPA